MFADAAFAAGKHMDDRVRGSALLAHRFGVIFLPPRKGDYAFRPVLIIWLRFARGGFVPLARAQSGEWKQLFDGKDLVGWKHVGRGEMTVEDGLIRTHGGMGLLYWTGGTLGDCVIRVVYKMRDQNDNSGVYIRIPIEPREAVDAGALRI